MKKLTVSITTGLLVIGASLSLAAPANAGIQLWDHANYDGYLGDFGRGTVNVGSAANDKATSLAVTAPANYAVLHEHADHRGASTNPFYVGTANLGWYSFNDITTSIS